MYFIYNRILFLTFLEAGNPRSKCLQVCYLERAMLLPRQGFVDVTFALCPYMVEGTEGENLPPQALL